MNKFVSWLKQKNRIPYLTYSALALFVLFPLIKPGFIFAMDMVFAPHIKLSEQFDLLNAFLYLLNFILPSQVIQKILLFLVLFLAGLGMHRLIPSKSVWPKYFAGIFYIFNPFVYSRFLYGHLFVLLAYAFFPFAIKSIFNFFKTPNWQNFLKLCLWFLLVGIVNLHGIAMLILFFIVALAFFAIKEKNRRKILELLTFSLLAILLCVSWLTFFKISGSDITQNIEGFNKKDLEAFQTVGDKTFGLPLNVLSLYGFWGDAQNQYVVQKAFVPWWPVLIVVILILVGWGIFVSLKIPLNPPFTKGETTLRSPSTSSRTKFRLDNLQWKTGIFLFTSVISFILALGIAWKPLAPLNQFLYDHIPFYYSFREPQKFVALLCLAYTFLGAIGIQDVLRRLKQKERKILHGIAAGFFVILPFLYSSGLFWGFHNQLYTTHYPQEWYEVNDLLNQDQKNFRVLFLPWHLYMHFDFAGKVIANPAPKFFDKEIIAGDNTQLGDIETHSFRPESKYIEEILQRRKTIRDLGKKLVPLNIKYVILAKEVDYIYYTKTFLDRQNDLEVIYEKGNLKVYQNMAVDNLID
jgi:hypothetical protein